MGKEGTTTISEWAVSAVRDVTIAGWQVKWERLRRGMDIGSGREGGGQSATCTLLVERLPPPPPSSHPSCHLPYPPTHISFYHCSTHKLIQRGGGYVRSSLSSHPSSTRQWVAPAYSDHDCIAIQPAHLGGARSAGLYSHSRPSCGYRSSLWPLACSPSSHCPLWCGQEFSPTSVGLPADFVLVAWSRLKG